MAIENFLGRKWRPTEQNPMDQRQEMSPTQQVQESMDRKAREFRERKAREAEEEKRQEERRAEMERAREIQKANHRKESKGVAPTKPQVPKQKQKLTPPKDDYTKRRGKAISELKRLRKKHKRFPAGTMDQVAAKHSVIPDDLRKAWRRAKK